MIAFGQGSWTWETLYSMPVYLRLFYMKQMSDLLSKDEQTAEKDLRRQVEVPNEIKKKLAEINKSG